MTNMPEEIMAHYDEVSWFEPGYEGVQDGWVKYIRAPQWQPIETAPRDGVILCYDHEWSEDGVALAENYDGEWWQICERDDNTRHFTPTHWMPIPQPPESEGE